MLSLPTRLHLVTFLMASGIAFVGITYSAVHDHEPDERPAAVFGVQVQRADGSGSGEPTGSGADAALSGSVVGLAPGVAVPLVLEIENDHDFPISVTDLRVTAQDASPACPASMLAVQSFAGERIVAGNSTATHTLLVALRPDASDACKNVLFPLDYSGTAVKA